MARAVVVKCLVSQSYANSIIQANVAQAGVEIELDNDIRTGHEAIISLQGPETLVRKVSEPILCVLCFC